MEKNTGYGGCPLRIVVLHKIKLHWPTAGATGAPLLGLNLQLN
jgi:hypothetical protein